MATRGGARATPPEPPGRVGLVGHPGAGPKQVYSDADTFPKHLRHHARVRGERPALRLKDRGIWRTWTWREVEDIVIRLAHALRTLGVSHGDRVAIAGANRPKLYWAMAAAQALGAIPVPVYADAVAAELTKILENAGVRVAVVQDQEQVDKFIAINETLRCIEYVLYDEARGLADYDHSRLRDMDDLINGAGAEFARDPALRAAIEDRIEAGSGDDISVMLYTSGTTGLSKGVMLSAAGCVNAARDTAGFDNLNDQDEVLAYLPLAWVGDHYMNYAQSMVAGFCMACPESAETVQQDLREIGPTFYFAPPRVFEGLLTRVMIRMEDASALKRRMFHHFIDFAKVWGEKILNGESVPLMARLRYRLGETLVYGPLKNVLGFSRIRVAYTAGEAIGGDLFAFYRSLGMNLKQLYGQTEAFLYVTCHKDGEVNVETVGPPAPNVDIRISEDGEVLFKSPGRFVSYYGDAARTAEAMTPDGYVKTGDAGIFDARGQLRIIDRAKDVGKLADGSLFAPKFIENKLKFFPNIREAVAYGDRRDFVAVMINIDLTAVGNWAERNNISWASYQELAAHSGVYDMIQKHVESVNEALAREPMMQGAQIRRFLVLHKELDADDGEVTRTQKVRRGFVAERYAPLVEGLYNGASLADVSTEVTFEDGRKGVISARVRIRDVAAAKPTRERAA